MADQRLRVLIESLFSDKGTTAAQQANANVARSMDTVAQTSAQLSIVQNKLALAMHNVQASTSALSKAQSELRNNTDPTKQEQLTGAVLKARVAVDNEVTAVEKLQKELNDLKDPTDQVTKKTGLLSGTLGKLVAGGALLTLGKQLLDFGKASVAVASDVEEAASKFQYTFGPAATDVGNRLDTFAESANRSRFEMRSMAADVGALTESTLGSKEAAGDMAVAISKLAVDLASFNNVTEADALTALRAGLIGEAEPMRRFGVLLSEAAVQQYIFTNGMAKTKGEITDSMKMQARYNIIMQQTATAQGDAERTSDSYANVTRGLQASIQDLQAAVGEGLLPTMTKAKTEMAGAIGAFADFWSASNALKAAQEGGIITQAEYLKIQAQLTYGSMTAAEAVTLLNKKYEESQAAHKAIAEAAALTTEELEQLAPAIEAAAGADKKFSQEADYAIQKLYEQDQAYRAVMRTLGAHSPLVAQDTRELEEAAYASGELGNAQDRLKGYLEADSAAMKEQEAAAKSAADALAAYVAHSGDLAVQAMKSDEGLGFFNETLDELGTHMVRTGGLTAQQADDLSRMQTAYNKAAATVRDYELGVKGANLTDDARNKKIEEQMAIMATLEGNMQPLLSVSGDLTAVTQGLTVNQEAVAQALIGAADAAGMDAEAIIGIGLAYGTISEAQAEYMLKQIAIQQEAEYLISTMREQGLTFDDVKSRMDRFIAGLEGTASSAATSAASVRGYRGELDAIPPSVSTDIITNHIDRYTSEGGAGQGGSTRSESGGHRYASGADFVVPPGYPNDSFGPMFAQTGERVTVTPAGQNGRMGGGITIQKLEINVNGQGGGRMMGQQVAASVSQKLGELS